MSGKELVVGTGEERRFDVSYLDADRSSCAIPVVID
jgi:hypothetical protein